MAQQQEVLVETSSQSLDCHPTYLVEMFMDIETHEEWNFTHILEIPVCCENGKYLFDEDVCWEFSNSSSIQLDCNNQNQYTSNVLTLQCLLLYMQYSYSPKICINVIPQPWTCTYNVVWLWWNCLWYFVQVVYYAPTTFECTHECTHALIYFTLDSRPLLALKRGCACVGV